MLKNNEVYFQDLNFMEIVKRETFKKDKLDVVPLPFHVPNLMLPNGKKQVILRLIKAQKNFSEAQKIVSRLSEVYGKSVNSWLSEKSQT